MGTKTYKKTGLCTHKIPSRTWVLKRSILYLCYINHVTHINHLKHLQMDFKEIIVTALGVALGFVIGSILLAKLPSALTGGWEESYEKSHNS